MMPEVTCILTCEYEFRIEDNSLEEAEEVALEYFKDRWESCKHDAEIECSWD